MELARIGSATPRMIEEPCLGFDRISSRSVLRSSFTVPVSQHEDRLPIREDFFTHPLIYRFPGFRYARLSRARGVRSDGERTTK